MPRSKASLPGGARLSDYVTLGALAQSFPAETIRESVKEAGKESVRRRDLPAELIVLYCVSLWLFRDIAYEDVLDCLLESWRWLGLPGSRGATKGAISQARTRLGPEPMRLLFNKTAVPLATSVTPGARYRGKRTVAIDGILFNTPDTQENSEEFGRPSNHFSVGPFPKVRAVLLSETSTHAPFGCAIGSYQTSEIELARELVGRVQPDMLVLADRYYLRPELWKEFCLTGATLLWRIQKNAPVKVINRLKDGSYLGRLSYDGPEVLVRIIAYKVGDSADEVRLVTNELDPQKAPAMELAKLYPERWEVELAFDELKSHVNESRLDLRSKTPGLIKQEIWGLMLLHWSLRSLMHDAAIAHARDPDTISFVRAVRLVKLLFTKDGNFSPEEPR